MTASSEARPKVVAAVVIGIAVLALVLVGFTASGWWGRARQSPAETVLHYLAAIADADADSALKLLADPPADRRLLTPAVLSTSRTLNPMTQIRVRQTSPTEVTATYLLGGQEVTARFDLVREFDGVYRIQRGTTTAYLTLPQNLPVHINGVPVTNHQAEVFPGAYVLTTGLENVHYVDADFIVSGPRANPKLVPTAELSQRGREAFLQAAAARLADCVTKKSLNPDGCPQRVALQADQEPDTPSIVWTVLGDPFSGATPRLSVNDQTVAELRLEVRLQLRAAMSQSGVPGTVDDTLVFSTTVTGQVTTDPIQVRFVNS